MNMLFSSSKQAVWSLVIFFAALFPLYAQQSSSFKVLDQRTQEPIIGLMYQYGNQSGISNDQGFIHLIKIPGETLYLSHLNYGKWSLTADQLQPVLEMGLLYRQEQLLTLQPVSVISLKMAEEKDKKILISDQERLHHDAGDILNLNPVVNGIRKSGAFAYDPVMRGFKYDQLNVVIDGLQTANAACPNRMDPPTSQVALNRIKQVEILKGPHALRYGIGLGGTINYIQEDPMFSMQAGVYGRYSSMYESNGDIFRHEGRVGFSGENYDIGIMGSWSKGGNYLDGAGNSVPASFKRGTLGIYADVKLSHHDLLQFTLNRNFARDVDFPTLNMDLRSDDTWMGSLRHTRNFHGRKLQKWTNSGYATFVDHLMDNGLREIQPRMMNSSTPAKTQNLGVRTEGQWNFGKAKLFAGADFRTEAAQGIREREFLMGPNAGKVFLDNAWQDSRISKAGIFSTYQLPLGPYVLSLAGRLDVNQATAKDTEPEFVTQNEGSQVTQLNPGVSAGLKRDLGKNFHAGLWLARVQRSGSITERFINYFPVGVDPYEMLGNVALKPETNNQVDFVLGYGKKGLNLEVSLFAAYLTDYITAQKINVTPRISSSPGVRQFINVDEALKTGLELTFSQNLPLGFQQQLLMAYTRGQNISTMEALPEIAPLDLRYSLLGRHVNGKLHTAVRLRHVAAQNRISESFGERQTPRFTLIDVDASYNFNRMFSLKLGVQNLLDQNYYEHLNRPIGPNRIPIFAPGRNYFAMFIVKFP